MCDENNLSNEYTKFPVKLKKIGTRTFSILHKVCEGHGRVM